MTSKTSRDQIELLRSLPHPEFRFETPGATTTTSADEVTVRPGHELPTKRELELDPYDQEIFDLAVDIRMNGLQSPVKITQDNFIVDGRKRVEALRLLSWEPSFRHFGIVRLPKELDQYTTAELNDLADKN